jgi:beta-alanine degradation protein BauB
VAGLVRGKLRRQLNFRKLGVVGLPAGGHREMKSVAVCAALLGALLLGGIVMTHSQENPARTQRVPQFENDDVKVWKSVILPGAPLTLHRHDHPRVLIALSGGTMNIVEQGGPAEQHVWETGRAYWLPANAPNTLHTDVNAGDKPIEVMVVELKHEN